MCETHTGPVSASYRDRVTVLQESALHVHRASVHPAALEE
jgi:hypothetical protein